MASLSLPPLRADLAWAVEQGMSIRDQLTEEQLIALERVVSGKEPWSFLHYQPLRAFALALPRLTVPDLPAPLSFGDVLQGLDELRAPTTPAWSTHETVSEATFRELSYSSTSAAITRVRESHAAAWREHGEKNRALLLRGAEHARGSRAVVIGAGKLYDIPLRKLAERFEQLLLVDVDAAAMAESVEQIGLPPGLRSRVTLAQAEVTGINDLFLERATAALAFAEEDEVYAALLQVLHAYRLDHPPQLFPAHADAGPFDLACSSMVLSQLATPLTRYVEQRFAARFPESQRIQAREFQIALGQFTHRVQHEHVRSLLATAPTIALTSDFTDLFTALDPRGNLMHAPARLPLIGALSLEQLVPTLQARIAFSSEWEWRHVVPTRSKPQGRTVQVAGVVADRL